MNFKCFRRVNDHHRTNDGAALGRFRPALEVLEDRAVPATFTPAPGTPDGAAGSLRANLITANGNNQSDVFIFQAGVYRLSVVNLNNATDNNLQENLAATGDLDLTEVNRTITFQGQGAGITVIDAAGLNDRVLHILANVRVQLRDLTIRGGLALEQGSPGQQNGAARGGGIFNAGGDLTLERVVIEGNEARGRPGTGSAAEGGGVHSTGPLLIHDSTIRNNLALGAEGIQGSFSSLSGAFVSIPGGQGLAGGVLVTSNSAATVFNSTFAGNQAIGGRGGLGSVGESGFQGNVGGPGGKGGNARSGAGIAIRNGSSLTLINATVSSNRATGGPGGTGGPGLSGAAQGNGGAGGDAEGGGVAVDGSTLDLFNSTIAANLTFTNSGGPGTVPGGLGQTFGGGLDAIDDNTATVRSTSSLIADNAAVLGPDAHVAFDAVFRTLVENGAGALREAGATDTPLQNNDIDGNRVGVDPRLGPLAGNGGPTATHALLLGSAAVDGGSNPLGLEFDQPPRHLAGALGDAPDIGAFESTPWIVAATGPGQTGVVRIFDSRTGALLRAIVPYGNFTGGLRVAVADVNGDGPPDIIVAPAAGAQRIKVISGAALHLIPASGAIPAAALIGNFFPFAPTFASGLFVAAADVNDDGKNDIVVGQGQGGSAVRVVSGAKVGQVAANGQIIGAALLGNFLVYPASFTGGVSVAAGDVNADGKADVIVGPASGLQRIRVINGTQLGQVQAGGFIAPSTFLGNFLAYPPSFTAGVRVAAGDINGDGRADVLVAPRVGAQPLRAVDGTKLTQIAANGQINDSAVLASFFPFGAAFGAGLSIDAVDVNGDGRADFVVGSGPGVVSSVRVFDGVTRQLLRGIVAFNNPLGVFVAG